MAGERELGSSNAGRDSVVPGDLNPFGISCFKSKCGPGKSFMTSSMPRSPPGFDRCSMMRTLSGAYPEYTCEMSSASSCGSVSSTINFIALRTLLYDDRVSYTDEKRGPCEYE